MFLAKDVIMPQLGMSMEEGTIIEWHKKEGEEVGKDELLFELETEKLTQKVEAPASGVLKKILVEVGETVPVKEKVAVISEKE